MSISEFPGVYLGDSVYATAERGMVKLYTDNGMGADQVIYLEAEVIQRLVPFLTGALQAMVENAKDKH